MTTERPPGTMPTGPYREPDKMDIYMNFHKNGNPALIGEHNQQHDTRTHSHSNAHAHAHGKSAHADMVKSVEDLSMTHRDPINLSSYVRIGFEEVFAEPDGQQSFDAIWTTSFIVYTQAKTWCYRLLSAILSIPLALLWGIHFAILTFCHIWFVMPCGRAWLVLLHWVGKFWNVCIRTLCDPLGDSCSRFLGNVKVQMNPTHHV
ncbi:caveolin-3-like [Diadema setosum]|uniref:caveolin-3-like n=1 Tax=Diadema setosum TaxID=31175 RepID=UPI003B3AD7B3